MMHLSAFYILEWAGPDMDARFIEGNTRIYDIRETAQIV